LHSNKIFQALALIFNQVTIPPVIFVFLSYWKKASLFSSWVGNGHVLIPCFKMAGRSRQQMTKILHIITRLDMGGSAQNTLLTCLELSRKYEMVLA